MFRRPTQLQRTQRQQHKEHVQLPWRYLIASIVLISYGYWLISTPWLRISSITCTDQFSRSCSPEMMYEVQALSGQHIFFVTLDEFTHNFQQSFPIIRQVKFSRSLPQSLTINIEIDPPLYSILEPDQKLVISKQGFVTKTTELPSSLPLLTALTPIIDETQKKLPELTHHTARELISFAVVQNGKIGEITWKNPNEILINLPDSKLAVLKQEKISTQLRLLQILLDKPLEVEWRELDLRFDQPIAR